MSPIVGITDKVQAAFPRIGKLRKGGPMREKDGKKYMGPDLEYFRFTSDRPEVATAFVATYGDKPALINCYLPHAIVEDNFDTWKEKWAAGGLVHRCNGETMTLWLGPDGKHYRTPKPCDGGCQPVGRLSLWIPELITAGFIGYVTLETHGINDLISIQASLKAGLQARGFTDLRDIEWRLYRIKEKISTPGQNGTRARRDKWLVKLEPAPKWVALQIETSRAKAYDALPAPRVVDEATREVSRDMPVSPEELARELEGADPPIDDVEAPDEIEYGDYTEEGTIHTVPIRTEVELRKSVRGLAKQLGFKKDELWATKYQELYSEPFEEASYDNLVACEKRLADALAAKGAA